MYNVQSVKIKKDIYKSGEINKVLAKSRYNRTIKIIIKKAIVPKKPEDKSIK